MASPTTSLSSRYTQEARRTPSSWFADDHLERREGSRSLSIAVRRPGVSRNFWEVHAARHLWLLTILSGPLSLRVGIEPKGLMKRYITYAMTALFATIAVSIAAPDKAAFEAKEKAAWQAFKDKKADDFKKVVAADFIGVYAEGISDMKKEMDDMQKWNMKSFAISDYNVVSAGADTMMSSYKVTIEGTYDGKDASGTFNAGSVWKTHNGEWQAIFHTNVKQEKPASK
jgi:hypothetical protein